MHLLHKYKHCESYWKSVTGSCQSIDTEVTHFLSGLNPWKGEDAPDQVCTVRCNSATGLKPGWEHLIWCAGKTEINHHITLTVFPFQRVLQQHRTVLPLMHFVISSPLTFPAVSSLKY